MVHWSKALAAAGAAAFFFGCANYASLQDADVVEKGKGSFGLGVTYTTYSFDMSLSESDTHNDTLKVSVPALNLWYRKGITDKLEAHANMWLPLGLSIGVKYQLLGSLQKAGFGLALGLDGGYLQMSSDSSSVTLVDLYVPIYAGYKFNESLGLYLVPKYIPRLMFGEDEIGMRNVVAGTVGLRLGKETRFMVEGTYGLDLESSMPVFTTGMGISF
jgi:hypothetical protein